MIYHYQLDLLIFSSRIIFCCCLGLVPLIPRSVRIIHQTRKKNTNHKQNRPGSVSNSPSQITESVTPRQYHPRSTKDLDHESEYNRGRMSRPTRSMDNNNPPSSSSATAAAGGGGPLNNARSAALTHSSRQRSYSRSPSQESAASQEIDEMLLEATTIDDRRQHRSSSMHGHGHHHHQQQQHHHRGGGGGDYHIPYRGDSPSSEYPGSAHPQHTSHPPFPHSRPRGTGSITHLDAHSPNPGPPGASVMVGPTMHADTTGPLQQPGQVQTYQTHIFAPPVTGAPVKKSKYMPGSTGGPTTNVAGASGSGNAQG